MDADSQASVAVTIPQDRIATGRSRLAREARATLPSPPMPKPPET